MADKMGISQEELFKLLLKKLGGLDEAQRSFDDVFADFIETDDATEIKAYIKTKGKDAIAKIKAKLPAIKDAARTKLAKLMKVELDEVNLNKEVQMNKTKMSPDAKAVIDLITRQPMILQKLSLVNNKEELQSVFDFLLSKINQTYSKSTSQVRTATNQTLLNREKIAPKLESLISKLMNETLSKKSAR
jgi:hypothetical protein